MKRSLLNWLTLPLFLAVYYMELVLEAIVYLITEPTRSWQQIKEWLNL